MESTTHHLQFIQDQGRDPNLLTEAVRYLTLKHAIPPMAEDIRWFQNMLEVLVELCCPNQGVGPEQGRFFQELRTGISLAESE